MGSKKSQTKNDSGIQLNILLTRLQYNGHIKICRRDGEVGHEKGKMERKKILQDFTKTIYKPYNI
jgi:hypothetical protein